MNEVFFNSMNCLLAQQNKLGN